MRFRIYSHKHKLYTDDPMWPSNQRSFSEWFVSPDGEIIELIGFQDGENVWYSKETHSPKKFTVEHFTGFIVESGQKIFQGDILRLTCFKLDYEAIWKEDRFMLKALYEKTNESPHYFPTQKELINGWEIVGTIHDPV